MREDSSRHRPACARPASPIRPGTVKGMTTPAPEPLPEVATVARDLLRMNTVNWGGGRSEGERDAAEYLEARLEAMGLRPQLFESEPERVSVVARVEGADPTRPALVL